MEDMISRKAAIDALVKAIRKDPYYDSNEAINGLGVCDVRVILNDLPSAQPETHDKRTETHACDLIERQAAIDAFYKHPNINWTTLDVLAKINALPSAQPETAKRIVGKTRNGMTLWYQCDMCNEPVDAQDNFCRGCGRRLTDG